MVCDLQAADRTSRNVASARYMIKLDSDFTNTKSLSLLLVNHLSSDNAVQQLTGQNIQSALVIHI